MHCTKKQQPIVHPFQPFPPSTKQYQIRYHFFLKAKEGASKKVEQKLFLPYFLLGRVNDEDCRRKREECRHSCNYLSSASFTQWTRCTKQTRRNNLGKIHIPVRRKFAASIIVLNTKTNLSNFVIQYMKILRPFYFEKSCYRPIITSIFLPDLLTLFFKS